MLHFLFFTRLRQDKRKPSMAEHGVLPPPPQREDLQIPPRADLLVPPPLPPVEPPPPPPPPGQELARPPREPLPPAALPAGGMEAIQHLTLLLQSSVRRMEALEEAAGHADTARVSQRLLREAEARQEVDAAFRPIRDIASPDKTVSNQLRSIRFISAQIQEASLQLSMLTRLPADADAVEWQGYARAAATAAQEGNKALLIYATGLSRVHDLGLEFACASSTKVMASELDSFASSAGFAPAFQDAWTKREDALQREKDREYRQPKSRDSQQSRRGGNRAGTNRYRSASPTEPDHPSVKRKLDSSQEQRGRGRGASSSRGRGSHPAPAAAH